jgi:hypothetical protein
VVGYRVYSIEADGRIATLPRVMECADDEEAIQQAKRMKDGKVLEVWDGARQVAEIGAS